MHRLRAANHSRQRHGAIVLLMLGILVVASLLAALVLNWSYLVLAQRDMQHRTDILGLAAARELLDEDLLRGGPANQSDDVQRALATGHLYREINNQHASTYLQLQPTDVQFTPGRIADATGELAPVQFTGNVPFNTLRVITRRDTTSGNPLAWLVNWFREEPVGVAAHAYAMLDNRAVGFRPTAGQNAPLAPIAIDAAAWSQDRTQDLYPNGGNGILELRLRLGQVGQPGPANSALVSYDGLLEPWLVRKQITDGVAATDLSLPGQVVGPVRAGGAPVILRGRQELAASWTGPINQRLQMAAPAGVTCQRAFPLYRLDDPLTDVAAGRFRVIGFVAGRIIGESIGKGAVEFSLEPCFLVHPTLWTEPYGASNIYLHKLRLVR